MTDYLTKPINKSLLLTMVQKCANSAPSRRNSPLPPIIRFGEGSNMGVWKVSEY